MAARAYSWVTRLRLRVSGNGVGLRFKLLANEALDLIPKVGIAFALHVIRCNSAVEPRHAVTLDRILMVVKSIVAEDLGLGVVRSPNLAASMQNAMRLVKIGGLDDVVRNDPIVLPRLGNRVDLDSEEDRDFVSIEFAGQEYDCRSTPALAEQDDARAGFFFGAEIAVVIFVDEANDAVISRFSMTVLKHLYVGIFRGGLSDPLCQENWSVMGIVVADKAAYKANEDVRRRLR